MKRTFGYPNFKIGSVPNMSFFIKCIIEMSAHTTLCSFLHFIESKFEPFRTFRHSNFSFCHSVGWDFRFEKFLELTSIDSHLNVLFDFYFVKTVLFVSMKIVVCFYLKNCLNMFQNFFVENCFDNGLFRFTWKRILIINLNLN